MLTEIADDMGAAANAGGFDRDEVHLSRTPLTLDAQGWQDINEALQQVAERALEIQGESAARLQADGASDSEAGGTRCRCCSSRARRTRAPGGEQEPGREKKKG